MQSLEDVLKPELLKEWFCSRSDQVVGIREEPTSCPIATYLKENFPKADYVDVLGESNMVSADNQFVYAEDEYAWITDFVLKIDPSKHTDECVISVCKHLDVKGAEACRIMEDIIDHQS